MLKYPYAYNFRQIERQRKRKSENNAAKKLWGFFFSFPRLLLLLPGTRDGEKMRIVQKLTLTKLPGTGITAL